VIWGALHGGALAVNRAWQRRPGAKPRADGWTPGRIASVFATFHFVCFAWIFFRAPSFAHALAILGQLGKLSFATPNLVPRILAVLALGFVTHWIPDGAYAKLRDLFIKSPAVAQGIALAVCAWVLHFAAAAKAEPFIYGQF
jgi:hypothetical protein